MRSETRRLGLGALGIALVACSVSLADESQVPKPPQPAQEQGANSEQDMPPKPPKTTAMTEDDRPKPPKKEGTTAEAAKPPKPFQVEGTLGNVTPNSVSIYTSIGTEVRLHLTKKTKIELNGAPSRAHRLPIGSAAKATYDPATNVALRVEVNR